MTSDVILYHHDVINQYGGRVRILRMIPYVYVYALSTGVDKYVYAFATYPITGLSTGVIRQLFSDLYRSIKRNRYINNMIKIIQGNSGNTLIVIKIRVIILQKLNTKEKLRQINRKSKTI